MYGLLRLLGMILVKTLPAAYSSIADYYLPPRDFFFCSSTVVGNAVIFLQLWGCEDSSMYILHFHAPCNKNAACLPLKGLISQLLG